MAAWAGPASPDVGRGVAMAVAGVGASASTAAEPRRRPRVHRRAALLSLAAAAAALCAAAAAAAAAVRGAAAGASCSEEEREEDTSGFAFLADGGIAPRPTRRAASAWGVGGCAFALFRPYKKHPFKNRKNYVPLGKQDLIRRLQSRSTPQWHVAKNVNKMHKLKFFQSSWEYTCAIKKLTEVHLWASAIELWGMMRNRGVDQTPATYTSAIVALQGGMAWKKAIEVYDEMKLADQFPLRIGCNRLARAFEAGGEWQRSIQLLDEMWQNGQVLAKDVYMPAVCTCENTGHFETGKKLFWKMRDLVKLTKAEDPRREVAYERLPPKPNTNEPWRIPGLPTREQFEPPKLMEDPLTKRRYSAHDDDFVAGAPPKWADYVPKTTQKEDLEDGDGADSSAKA